MANTNAPFGFRFANRSTVAGAPNGQATPYRLASGTAADIYVGDVVKFLTTGYVTKAAASDQMRGVVVGMSWVALDGTPKYGPYWPSGTVTKNGADATLIVVDDPNAIFECRYSNSTTAPAKTDLGATFQIYIPSPAGNTSTGVSYEGIDYTTLNTTAQPWRLLDFSTSFSNDATSAYARAYVTPALHDFRVNTGI